MKLIEKMFGGEDASACHTHSYWECESREEYDLIRQTKLDKRKRIEEDYRNFKRLHTQAKADMLTPQSEGYRLKWLFHHYKVGYECGMQIIDKTWKERDGWHHSPPRIKGYGFSVEEKEGVNSHTDTFFLPGVEYNPDCLKDL